MLNPSSRNVASGNNLQCRPAAGEPGDRPLFRVSSSPQLPAAGGGPPICTDSVSIDVTRDFGRSADYAETVRPSHNARTTKASALERCASACGLNRATVCKDSRPSAKCAFSYLMKVYRRRSQIVIPFIWGILVGITMTAVCFQQHILFRGAVPWPDDGGRYVEAWERANNFSVNDPRKETRGPETVSVRALQQQHPKDTVVVEEQSLSSAQADGHARFKTRIFVGVITAEKFLGSRSVAVNNTWGGQVDKLEFFAAKGTQNEFHVPVVNLQGISDTEYPPQRKMFTMLKHMCEHHADNYEWFIRADDDVYIRVERLRSFLSQIDGDRMIYMGQPGHGVPEVREKLGLNGHNFCMGGPGVIFNQKALKALCPHIDHCMEEVVSGEEDVELGRCVTNHLHIECTHAWETLKLFYHSYQEEYTEEKPFLGNLAENDHVSRALTLHHIKVPYIMYRVHRHYTSLLLNATTQELSAVGKDLDRTNVVLPLDQQRFISMEKTLVPEFKPRRLKDVNAWHSFEVDSIYSLAPSLVVQDITNDMLADLKQIGETGIDETIGVPQQQAFSYSHVSDGYVRSDPHRGTDYFLDVYFSSKQPGTPDQIRRVRLLRPAGDLEVTGMRDYKTASKGRASYFFVIVAVGRSQSSTFETFMRNHFESAFLSTRGDARPVLVAVPYQDEGGDDDRKSGMSPSAEDVIKWYGIKHPNAHILSVPPPEAPESRRGMQDAYALGLLRAEKFLTESAAANGVSYALLTSPNLSLTADVIDTCVRRTSGSSAADGENGYNFLDYKAGRSRRSPSSLLYQPVPFRVLPSASVTSWESTYGADGIAKSSLTSNVGFWDPSVAAGEEGNALTAPLCGQFGQFLPSARDAAAQQNGTAAAVGDFRDALFRRVYAGELRVMRSPDRAFVNVPRS